jgi:hypothetical protein
MFGLNHAPQGLSDETDHSRPIPDRSGWNPTVFQNDVLQRDESPMTRRVFRKVRIA